MSVARIVRTLAAALLGLALAACAPPPDGGTLRDLNVPIGVTSRYDDARFGGAWQVRGAYPVDGDLVTVERIGRVQDGAAWILAAQPCPTCPVSQTTWVGEVDVPGADRLRSPTGAMRRAVVIWVDEGFRTGAIADPDGQFAWVLDRNATGGADRIKAARQILEFSGFDLATMRMRP
ncbi:lipocalin [uncultured Tateyamaria sp.]|uniref:lipocalin n=1 Tax=uncultured Tateyamaria sp. TaxID=455651 RepID=UPI00260F16A0|nr:lipocalin [uncultured Tateyamaria sp.]